MGTVDLLHHFRHLIRRHLAQFVLLLNLHTEGSGPKTRSYIPSGEDTFVYFSGPGYGPQFGCPIHQHDVEGFRTSYPNGRLSQLRVSIRRHRFL